MSKVMEILADLTCTNYKDYSLAGRDATEKVWNKLKKQAETAIRAAIADELEGMKKKIVLTSPLEFEDINVQAKFLHDRSKDMGYNRAITDCQKKVRGEG